MNITRHTLIFFSERLNKLHFLMKEKELNENEYKEYEYLTKRLSNFYKRHKR